MMLTYHEEMARRGVATLAGVADKPWGMREFGIKRSDGHVWPADRKRAGRGGAVVEPYDPAWPREFARAADELWQALGVDLRRRAPDDIEGYMDGKDGFIKRVAAQALRWSQDALKP